MIDLNFVVVIDGTQAAFGPFSSMEHAELWALNGAKGLNYKILRYIDLTETEKVSGDG